MLETLILFSTAIVILCIWAIFTRHRFVRLRALLGALCCFVLMWEPFVCLFAPWYYFRDAENKSQYYHEVTRMWCHVPWLKGRDIDADLNAMSPQEMIDYMGEPNNTNRRDRVCLWLNSSKRGTVASLLRDGHNLSGCFYIFQDADVEPGEPNYLRIKFFGLEHWMYED